MEGKLVILSAPSGSGKSTIVTHLLKQHLGLAFSISATSRIPREGEQDGREYYFISPEEFREKISNHEFIEWEEVYPGQFYGTLRSEIERIWKEGMTAIFDIDVAGGLNLKREYGHRAFAVFVKPPSMETLEERLRLRGTDSIESLEKRLGKAGYEMDFEGQFDHILVNDSLQRVLVEAEEVVRNFLEK
jgi:guanylate kinase